MMKSANPKIGGMLILFIHPSSEMGPDGVSVLSNTECLHYLGIPFIFPYNSLFLLCVQ